MSHDSTQPNHYQVDALIDSKRSVFSHPSENSSNSDQRLLRLDARAIADASNGLIENASIVLKESQGVIEIVASGPREQIDRLNLSPVIPQLTLNTSVLMPALVNAHTHLDLSHIGPQPHNPESGFVSWVNMIRRERKTTNSEIRQAVGLGIAKSIAGGCIAVGDIAGAPAGILTDAPALELAESPLIGVSYLEFFGIGKTAAKACQKIQAYLLDQYPLTHKLISDRAVKLGLQPHAPNTVDLSVYRWVRLAAKHHGLPISTHLAETIEEREFIESGSGPQRIMLEELGVWDDSILDHIGKGNHPSTHLLEDSTPDLPAYLVAHVNDAADEAIETLARTNTSVAYCPRASAYFGAHRHFGPHRYREMLDAGVNVCLGTDSIVNLDTDDRISTLDEMRFLWNRDRTDPTTLIQMGTVNGASALGIDPKYFTLEPGAKPWGLIALSLDPGCREPWPELMSTKNAPEWVFLRNK